MNQMLALPALPVKIPDGGQLTGPVVLFRMKSDQYLQLPECLRLRMELWNGWVVILPPPSMDHQEFAADLYAVLKTWVKAQQLGRVSPSVDMRLNDDWTPGPDILFVSTANLSRIRNGRVYSPADLAVEVLSPSHPDTDLEVKFIGYAQNGVPWYWIIDLDARTLDEYELVSGAYGNRVTVPFGQPFAPRLFPGLTIDLATLGT